jgi:hypothetical protein
MSLHLLKYMIVFICSLNWAHFSIEVTIIIHLLSSSSDSIAIYFSNVFTGKIISVENMGGVIM